MESTIGLSKTELIKPRRPWKTLSDAELVTAESTGTTTDDSTVRQATFHRSNTRTTTTFAATKPRSQPTSEISAEPGAVQGCR
ncbi:hypothetical protein NFX46_20510 [Streptomyces phaeoluteigriseus]|uniref:Uncharacterized protein n=1 Tax=Streptomyces phaeoluteigriseus TaxID=114686 RepID=A0ABY4ZC55_9ACTN|nr:hypothetical protein [Streptomyces phaeoluteigriseus]USQ85902.1 hypothetical protein NFX46_20510 [Streptomyces phaeoluteigriseus]